MKKSVCLSVLSLCFILASCGQNKPGNSPNQSQTTEQETASTEDCNWCGTSEAPEDVTWRTVIPPTGEPGEKLIISGTVFLSDGKTPAKDAIIYVHHTNTKGTYPKRGDEKGNGQYHGYLRGWMKTDSNGRYEFETIRPAAYHSHEGEPAHIHYNIQAPGFSEYWLTALWFADDPRVNDAYRKSVKREGGFSNIITLTKDENGVLRGVRNIVLKKYE